MSDENKDALTKAQAEIDTIKAELQKAQDEAKEATAKAEKATADLAEAKKAEAPEPKPAVVDKSELAPEVRAALEKAESDAKELGDRLAKAEETAKAERDVRLTRDFIAKADTYKGLPVEATKFGPVLKAISESVSEETYSELEKALNAADEGIVKGDLFKTIGADGEKTDNSAIDEVQRKAEEIRKADPKVSSADAFELAMKSDRKLQERYLAEMRS